MSKPFENKLALVTGSSRGIGAAIAVRLAAEGAHVIVNYAASPARAEQVVAEITNAGGYAEAVQADLSTVDGTKTLVESANKVFGGKFGGRVDNRSDGRKEQTEPRPKGRGSHPQPNLRGG